MADLELTHHDGITTMIFNRPEARNALSMEMRSMLSDALHDAENDPAVRCVVLKGKGEHFLAGGDIKSMANALEQHGDELKKHFALRIHSLNPIMYAMRRMPKPVIASVQGAAAGAGASIAFSSDLVIAAEDAFFTMAYCRIGTSPDGSATYQLPRTVGIKKAMEITLLGDRFTAQTAKEWGLVNFVVPTADLEKDTDKLAQRLAKGPTYVYGRSKALLYRSMESQFESQLQAEAESFADCASRSDFREGVTAFLEKRKPNFTGN